VVEVLQLDDEEWISGNVVSRLSAHAFARHCSQAVQTRLWKAVSVLLTDASLADIRFTLEFPLYALTQISYALFRLHCILSNPCDAHVNGPAFPLFIWHPRNTMGDYQTDKELSYPACNPGALGPP